LAKKAAIEILKGAEMRMLIAGQPSGGGDLSIRPGDMQGGAPQLPFSSVSLVMTQQMECAKGNVTVTRIALRFIAD
jgi:hypothetical protein